MTIPRKNRLKRLTVVFLLAMLPFVAVSTRAAATDYEKPVFEFQSKLANQGNARAQYFLAQMYEEGRGTTVDAELAKHWYEQAKLNGYTPEARVASAN